MASKTNQLFFRFSLFMLLIIGGLLAYFLWHQYAFYKNQRNQNFDDTENTFKSYPGYGIWLPTNFEIHGIDVSRYQKRINWRLVRQMKDKGLQIQFAFVKATEGEDMKDPQFDRNWSKLKTHHLTRGAYHFFRESSDGHNQALYFIDNVVLTKGDLPPVLDVETYTGSDPASFIREIEVWLRVVGDHYKVKPIIYTNAGFYNKYLAGKFEDYPLWVAHYQNRNSPGVSRHWQFWQHNESGRVNGINAYVDFNVFNGTMDEFRQLLLP